MLKGSGHISEWALPWNPNEIEPECRQMDYFFYLKSDTKPRIPDSGSSLFLFRAGQAELPSLWAMVRDPHGLQAYHDIDAHRSEAAS